MLKTLNIKRCDITSLKIISRQLCNIRYLRLFKVTSSADNSLRSVFDKLRYCNETNLPIPVGSLVILAFEKSRTFITGMKWKNPLGNVSRPPFLTIKVKRLGKDGGIVSSSKLLVDRYSRCASFCRDPSP